MFNTSLRLKKCNLKYFATRNKYNLQKTMPSIPHLPGIGVLHQYLPVIGQYSNKKLVTTNMKKYKQFGPIVEEKLTSYDCPLLNLFEPDNFEEIFRSEAKTPSRHSHIALEYYRLNKSHLYNTGGLIPSNGNDWLRLRKAFQKELNTPQIVRTHLADVDSIIMEWIEYLKSDHKDLESKDFLTELWKIFLELIGWIVFRHRFNAFSSTNQHSELEALKLVKAALTTNYNVPNTDIGPKLWKVFELKPYKEIKISQDYMESVALKLISEAKNRFSKENINKPMILKWLEQDNVDEKDVLAMAVDILLAGIDTSSNTTSFVLYYLSNNKSIQQKCSAEVSKLLSTLSSPITEQVLDEAKYSKAVLKESLRLQPISIGIGRLTTEDRIIGDYHIPKGYNVLTNNQVACRLEKNFTNPMDFLPERWIRDNVGYKQPHPFLLLPFGYGARACIARRLAEQNILILIMKVLRNFHLQWMGDENVDAESQLINKPDKPIMIKFHSKG